MRYYNHTTLADAKVWSILSHGSFTSSIVDCMHRVYTFSFNQKSARKYLDKLCTEGRKHFFQISNVSKIFSTVEDNFNDSK